MYTESQVKKLQTLTLKLSNIEKSADPNASTTNVEERLCNHVSVILAHTFPNAVYISFAQSPISS